MREARACRDRWQYWPNVVAALADIAPDFATYLIEFLFGDIDSRLGLGPRDREIATIAALAAMGNAAPQLEVHIEAGLNVGLTRDEITEILMPTAVYAGFPAALNGLFAAKEVFAAKAGIDADWLVEDAPTLEVTENLVAVTDAQQVIPDVSLSIVTKPRRQPRSATTMGFPIGRGA